VFYVYLWWMGFVLFVLIGLAGLDADLFLD
jgi:hypothetical protein